MSIAIELFIKCYPTDIGAKHFPNSNFAIKSISVKDVIEMYNSHAPDQSTDNQEKEEITGFTEGPWRMFHSLKNHELHVWIHAKDLSSCSGRELQVFSFSDQHPIKEHLARRLADARLIASAPTMYAELQELRKELEAKDRTIEKMREENRRLENALDDLKHPF